MKTVLVTGGCGFIGSHFVRLLLRVTDWRVVNLDSLTYAGNVTNLEGLENGQRYRFVRGDITDFPLVEGVFKEEMPWGVVNFAAESHVDRSILDSSPFLRTNVLGVQVLLDVARLYGVERYVQVSTDEVYGDADGQESFTEDSPLSPSSPYAASKAAADLLCSAYRRTHQLPVLIVRSSNNYGPCQFPEKLIPLMIRNALNGEELPVYGDGLQRRDWLYVGDNCRAILGALEQGIPGAIYNVGGGEERTNLELVRAVCRLLAYEGQLDLSSLTERITFMPDRPGHDRRYALSSQRMRQELGWYPEVSLEEGLRRTIRWYLGHAERLKNDASAEYESYYDSVYRRAWGDRG